MQTVIIDTDIAINYLRGVPYNKIATKNIEHYPDKAILYKNKTSFGRIQ